MSESADRFAAYLTSVYGLRLTHFDIAVWTSRRYQGIIAYSRAKIPTLSVVGFKTRSLYQWETYAISVSR